MSSFVLVITIVVGSLWCPRLGGTLTVVGRGDIGMLANTAANINNLESALNFLSQLLHT